MKASNRLSLLTGLSGILLERLLKGTRANVPISLIGATASRFMKGSLSRESLHFPSAVCVANSTECLTKQVNRQKEYENTTLQLTRQNSWRTHSSAARQRGGRTKLVGIPLRTAGYHRDSG